MSRYWSDVVRRLTPYVPGEQPRHPRLVKLNTNESPYPPSPRVLDAIHRIDGDDLRRYPDPESTALRAAFAERAGLLPEQVFLGNGSDEVLAHVFMGLLRQAAPLLFPDISYSFYPVWCDLYGIVGEPVALRENFSIEVADYARPNGGIILPNPNAPTGMLLALEDIRRLLEANRDSVVVIDEAYIDFGGASAVTLVNTYDNLLVVQTLSKSRALAGLRVGVAYGHVDLIDGLQRVKNSFNSYPLDAVAQHAVLASLEDEAWFEASCTKVIASRSRLTQGLQTLGFTVLPSSANFVFASPGAEHDARALFLALRERGIIVRHFNKPRIADFLRISVGTDEQCEALLAALSDLMAAGAG
ncbi:MAG: histidinol-phosphate transaminase [Haliea sp.]|uniref:histidinol-phosphate transaminase n=1 Tax=Haliea sp. TaxID=1932666 RepID=UPI000C64597D|nr:histidinol-phosphate transaminase [Haliea sp.]MBM69947.1 histidinol-phosphate transaminase [Haliea sp.]|tara:strand:- start:2899 stop:3972 length:1074 start_codon:yes stop_codon:yes gene_type:complete